jgi:hypothetical protein
MQAGSRADKLVYRNIWRVVNDSVMTPLHPRIIFHVVDEHLYNELRDWSLGLNDATHGSKSIAWVVGNYCREFLSKPSKEL